MDIMKMGKNPNYLGSWDLEEISGREAVLTIDRIVDEEVFTNGPSHAVVCVDRTESADNTSVSAKRMIEDRYGVKIHPIVTAFDILKAAEKGVISAGEYTEKLREYITRYKGE